MSVLSSSFRVCLFLKDLMIASFFVTLPSQIPKRVKKKQQQPILKFLSSLGNTLNICVARICECVSLYFLKHAINKCKKLSLRQWFYYSI